MTPSRVLYLTAFGAIVICLFAFFQLKRSDQEKRQEAVEKQEEIFRQAQQSQAAFDRQQISLSDYTALQKGTPYDQVAQLHGPGKEMGRKVEYYRELVTYRWEDHPLVSSGGAPGWMELTFADGKLVEGKQEGLR